MTLYVRRSTDFLKNFVLCKSYSRTSIRQTFTFTKRTREGSLCFSVGHWHSAQSMATQSCCGGSGTGTPDSTDSRTWGYRDQPDMLGPSSWGKKYPDACGQHQSPINLKGGRLDPGLLSNPLRTEFASASGFLACNTGVTAMFKPTDKTAVSCIYNGPLKKKYELQQFHFHWGAENDRGSEHLVDGQAYAAEAHFVFLNSDLHNSDDIAKRSESLSVLGVFLEVGDNDHSELQKLVNCFQEIKHKDSQQLIQDIDLSKLLPTQRDYYTYHGSLTTPPCEETVMWIVFRQPISVSATQMKEFRELLCESGHSMADNFRPVQKLNDRVVWTTLQV